MYKLVMLRWGCPDQLPHPSSGPAHEITSTTYLFIHAEESSMTLFFNICLHRLIHGSEPSSAMSVACHMCLDLNEIRLVTVPGLHFLFH